MSTLKLKNSALKGYYIFDCNEGFGGLLQKYKWVLCKHTKVRYEKLLNRVLKSSAICNVKILRDDLKKVLQGAL